MSVVYQTPRGDDLDTRLLRANVLKGVLEGTTTAMVNLVNADLLAKKRGLSAHQCRLSNVMHGAPWVQDASGS
eukprot:scaffold305066_cov22-Tisochrysis_lutea.AAC.1